MRLLLGKKSILSTFILLSLFTQTVCKIGLSTLMKCQNIRHWEYSRALLGLLQGLHELSILCRAFNEKAHGLSSLTTRFSSIAGFQCHAIQNRSK